MTRRLLLITTILGAQYVAVTALAEPASALFERPVGGAALERLRPIGFDRDQRGNRVEIRHRGFRAEALAAGNVISVVTKGSGNTITINADQVNNGSQTATIALNGRLALD